MWILFVFKNDFSVDNYILSCLPLTKRFITPFFSLATTNITLFFTQQIRFHDERNTAYAVSRETIADLPGRKEPRRLYVPGENDSQRVRPAAY